MEYEEDHEGVAWKALKMLLAHNENVRLEKFNAILEWFGPFGRDAKLVENMLKTLRLRGFWGDVESTEVTNLLAGKPVGTFIIRFSSQQAGCYTLTVVEDGVMQNYRVQHRTGKKFSLGNPPKKFKSLKGVIKAFQAELHLKTPLPNSPYANLFVEVKDNYKNDYVIPKLPGQGKQKNPHGSKRTSKKKVT